MSFKKLLPVFALSLAGTTFANQPALADWVFEKTPSQKQITDEKRDGLLKMVEDVSTLAQTPIKSPVQPRIDTREVKDEPRITGYQYESTFKKEGDNKPQRQTRMWEITPDGPKLVVNYDGDADKQPDFEPEFRKSIDNYKRQQDDSHRFIQRRLDNMQNKAKRHYERAMEENFPEFTARNPDFANRIARPDIDRRWFETDVRRENNAFSIKSIIRQIQGDFMVVGKLDRTHYIVQNVCQESFAISTACPLFVLSTKEVMDIDYPLMHGDFIFVEGTTGGIANGGNAVINAKSVRFLGGAM